MSGNNENTRSTPDPQAMPFETDFSVLNHLFQSAFHLPAAFSRYAQEFVLPSMIALHPFLLEETHKNFTTPLSDTTAAARLFFELNTGLMLGALSGSQTVLSEAWLNSPLSLFFQEVFPPMTSGDGPLDPAEAADRFRHRVQVRGKALEYLARDYPQAMKDIRQDFGLDLDDPGYVLAAETDRYQLVQVLPNQKGVKINPTGKPILIIPPYVLGANILCFLPRQEKSYVHAFANQGIPVYIRIVKPMDTTPAVQTLTAEQDTLDTRHFCDIIRQNHNRAVTLNGYCQGGFTCLCSLLTGELDGLVDAFITCVSPIDGTRSERLAGFLSSLTRRFNDLAYGRKKLPGGNTVADGDLLAWVYKLSAIEQESPLVNFYRDLMMFVRQDRETPVISDTAAALNCWLTYDRTDIPMDIARQSFISYNTPISAEGILPVTQFGRILDIHRMSEKKIPWLICYGEGDDLVSRESALAPMDYVKCEVTPFPKGHVAIATSWSHPKSACALHTRFGDDGTRGPVRFHLDLDSADPKGMET